jgi:hypothetical protein
MSPQRSVVPDPEFSQRTRGEPVRVLLAGSSKLDDPQRDKFGYLISRTDGKLKLAAHSVKRVAHGLNVLGLESETTGSRSWHLGATDLRSWGRPRPADVRLPEPRSTDPKGKCLGPGPTQGPFPCAISLERASVVGIQRNRHTQGVNRDGAIPPFPRFAP